MSPVAIGLDLVLVTLLLTALFVGLKLNGRLKALRDGQVSFVQAVGDLDAAATRAESGLQALRIATEHTHDELLTRIETARGLIAKLDGMTDKATRLMETSAAAVPVPAPAARPPGPAPRYESRTAPRFQPVPPRPSAPRLGARGLDDDLFETAADFGPAATARPVTR